ncbi:MAG: 4'-phosphopantetheinyl transferase superfamily protein [Bacteroidaceae bacterium]|nr:4'-phosphopantetheinyl transferase superfamily protein [Bacteroidaceae bacterium]
MNWYLDTHPHGLDLDQALAQVSEQRRRYALRYKRESDQRLSLSAWLLLQRALRDEFGIDEQPLFRYTPQGKPLLEGHDDIHFSLSHCDEAVACVVGRHAVGIDVESLSQYDPALLEATMSEEEIRQVRAAHRPEVAFMRLWTMKESLLKLTGEGIRDRLDDVLVDAASYRFQTLIASRFVCTVCEKKPVHC